MTATDAKYWAEYDGLQHAKHQLLRYYLGGWFPKLASWQGRVLYLDCHAGRGRHDSGHEGSPILALNLLLGHSQRDKILSSTEVRFIFFEKDRTNYDHLCDEIGSLGELLDGVEIEIYQEDYEGALRKTIAELRSRGGSLAPSFAFVDPYGFTLSMDLLNELLSFHAGEFLINFMYRYVDMAIHQPSYEANMDRLFGIPDWRDLRDISNSEQRANQTIQLFSGQLNAKYVTHLYMRSVNGTLKYVLIHATNHIEGRRLMKQAIWSVTPDGSFTANERNSPYQPVLIQAEPDLRTLENALWEQFAGQKVTMKEIYDWLLSETFLEKHIHELLRHYRNVKIIEASGYSGRFAFKNNPLITFPATRP